MRTVADVSRATSVALVESATQLLNVVEWAHAAGAVNGLGVAVLAPRHVATRRQLGRVTALAMRAGIEVEHVELRMAHGPGQVADGMRIARELARAERLVIGDPFSRLIQTLLPITRAEQVVVVDDGTATWEFAECIDAGRPLLRWRLPQDDRRGRSARATRRLTPSPQRAVSVFTCLDGATPTGAQERRNDYAWTRGWRRPTVLHGATDLVGASLVETGLVDRRAYLDAVRRLTRSAGPVRYLAHRKESENRLAELATLPGVQIVRSDLPVELRLRQGPVAEHVVTFPSTAAHTLPVVLADVDVHLEVRRVETAWFTPASTRHARAFVTRIADDAPLEPVREIA